MCIYMPRVPPSKSRDTGRNFSCLAIGIMASITRRLLELDLFKAPTNALTLEQQITNGYHRARAIARCYGMSLLGELQDF